MKVFIAVLSESSDSVDCLFEWKECDGERVRRKELVGSCELGEGSWRWFGETGLPSLWRAVRER